MMDAQKKEAYSLTILLTGALPSDVGDISGRFADFHERLMIMWADTFPEWLPGDPPATIITSKLRDDWIKR
jgi:hypothetical protein